MFIRDLRLSPLDHFRRRFKELVQFQGPVLKCHNMFVSQGEKLLAPRPSTKFEDYPLSPVCNCLFNIPAATPLSRGRLLHPHRDVELCRDDGEPTYHVILTFALEYVKTIVGFYTRHYDLYRRPLQPVNPQATSVIYIYIYMERIFLMFLDHTQRPTTVGVTPLDE